MVNTTSKYKIIDKEFIQLKYFFMEMGTTKVFLELNIKYKKTLTKKEKSERYQKR